MRSENSYCKKLQKEYYRKIRKPILMKYRAKIEFALKVINNRAFREYHGISEDKAYDFLVKVFRLARDYELAEFFEERWNKEVKICGSSWKE